MSVRRSTSCLSKSASIIARSAQSTSSAWLNLPWRYSAILSATIWRVIFIGQTWVSFTLRQRKPGTVARSLSLVHVELERCRADDRIGQSQTLFSSELYRAGTDRQSQFTDHKLTQKFADLLFFFGCQGWPS